MPVPTEPNDKPLEILMREDRSAMALRIGETMIEVTPLQARGLAASLRKAADDVEAATKITRIIMPGAE